MTQRYRVAIVGAGIGAQHAAGFEQLAEAFEIAIIVDADLARARALADKHSVVDVHGAFDDALLARSDIDVIDICLPPFLHDEAIHRSLAAGKHVVCEKPLLGSIAAIDRAAAAAQAQRRVLMPIFQYRFGNGLRKARHLVESGAAGKAYLATVETHWNRGAAYYDVRWRGRRKTELGGVFLSHAIHAHDMLTLLLGEVAAVSARIGVRVNEVETEDCGGAVLEMADGSIAVLSATLGSADEISRLRLCFETVTMVSNLTPYMPSRDPWEFLPRAPRDAAWLAAALAEAPQGLESYAGQFALFHRALADQGAAPVELADARRSIELVSAIYHSSQTGQRVALPLTQHHPVYEGWL
jgi:predicted dehydrogenase